MLFYEKVNKEPYQMDASMASCYPFDRSNVNAQHTLSIQLETFPEFVPPKIKKLVQESNR